LLLFLILSYPASRNLLHFWIKTNLF